MSTTESSSNRKSPFAKAGRALSEAGGLLRAPYRIPSLFSRLLSDEFQAAFQNRHLYSYASTNVPTEDALRSLLKWILQAQKTDGGIAAYYSLLTGYACSYPEVTGYLIPTLYDIAENLKGTTGESAARESAERATAWLLSLQMPSGAFPGGLHVR